jgi:hypothetical membrane protein
MVLPRIRDARVSTLIFRTGASRALANSGTSPAPVSRARSLFAATIAGIALYLVLDAIAQSLPPHYSPISQAESDLGVGPYGYVMAVNFVNRGVLSLLFVYGLALSLPKGAGYRNGLALLGIWGVGALVLSVEPTDVSGPATVHGVIHLVVAILAFLAAALGILSLSGGFRRDPSLQSIARFARPVSVLALLFLVLLYGGPFILPHAMARVGGLVERIFIGLVLFWMLTVSVWMLRRPGPPPNAERSPA